MTDAHCHLKGNAGRHFLCEPTHEKLATEDMVFYGTHPWLVETFELESLRRKLVENPKAGVGEIGLDRLRNRVISDDMRTAFEQQLRLAAELHRPVVLHGAKCWGEVFKTVCKIAHDGIPAYLYHGFSRSDGLIPELVALRGYVSVGPAILNDHAVNYRRMVTKIPDNRLLVETDRTPENAEKTPSVEEIARKLAEIKGIGLEALTQQLEVNADAFTRI